MAKCDICGRGAFFGNQHCHKVLEPGGGVPRITPNNSRNTLNSCSAGPFSKA